MVKLATETELEAIPSIFARSPRSSLWTDVFKRFLRNRLAVLGLVIIIALVLAACLVPLFVSHQKAEGFHPKQVLQPPTISHPMGTDEFGRDILVKVLYGSQISVAVGFVAVLIGLAIGLSLGAVAGYFGGFFDTLIMRTADVFFAFPFILGALAIMTVLGPGLINVFIAIGILDWAYFARMFRGSILSVKENEYVEAARAVGASHFRIMWRHIFPNALAPVTVYTAMSISGAILTEAALSFLHLGSTLNQPSWGLMLADSMKYIGQAPWMMYFPGLALLITVLGFILLADGLRDALDPRLK